jgi:hypothetical protein
VRASPRAPCRPVVSRQGFIRTHLPWPGAGAGPHVNSALSESTSFWRWFFTLPHVPSQVLARDFSRMGPLGR